MDGARCLEKSEWSYFCSKTLVVSLSSYVTDGTAALLIGSLPLILPDKNPFRGRENMIWFCA